jgi:2-iminobutanoate/2-iminopropanoate deaminase
MLTPISAPAAPAPVGHYVPAIRLGDLLFLSGQLPIDPATKTPVTGDTLALARQVLSNLGAVLRAAGSRPNCVLRVNVYLTDPGQGPKVNAALVDFFGEEHRPTRTTVIVAGLPLGAPLEMDAIAWVPSPGP